MKNSDRSQDILNLLKEIRTASVEELASTLYVSSATIRRDLTKLEKSGAVKRTHGGVVYAENSDEESIYLRQASNPEEKMMVANIASRHIPDFDSAFIDNSSTLLYLCEKLNLRNKTVFTNGLQMALTISQQDNVNIIVPGGEVRYNTSAVHGSLTTKTLQQFNFDVSIISCAAVDATGSHENSLESMEVKKTAMERSKKRILLIDRTKIGKTAPYTSAPLEYYDLIVTNASDEEAAPLKEQNPNLVVTNR